MANFGKRPINDANEAAKVRASVPFVFNGEQRLDRRPYGHIERFIDPVGNVITLQLATPGDPMAAQTAARVRMEKRNDGWVEHAKCPLRHGIHNSTPALAREFEKRPAALRDQCVADPKVMKRENGELHALESCPHVEWLIADRIKREAKANAGRNKQRAEEEKRKLEAAELQAAQLEMVKEQLEERKARKSKPKAGNE
jgi:hypothetical protein